MILFTNYYAGPRTWAGSLEQNKKRKIDMRFDLTETGWGRMEWIDLAQDRNQ
jgi:hypothetical protein